ncbi:MAG: OmpP1/FadL family transporter [Thermoanaerobaculia bacterium]
MSGRHVLLAVITCVIASTLSAQSSADANSGLEFNFSSPGARSLGLGGAFVGIADDATAVFINPAGLTQLLKTEVALEGRFFSYSNTFPRSGRGNGQPSDIGIDTTSSVTEGEDLARLGGLSFASVVIPRDRWSFALYRHELANFRASAETEGIFFDRVTSNGTVRTGRFFPARGELRLRVVSFGGSVAYRLHDRVSIGLTAARQQTSLDSTTVQYAFTKDRIDLPASFDKPLQVQEQHSRENNVILQGGVLVRVTDDLMFGASYQEANDFRVRVRTSETDTDAFSEEEGGFQVPAVYRAGLSYTYRHYTKVSLEVDRVLYSGLTRNFVALDGEAPLYRANDGTEVRLGIQRLLVHDWIISRIGQPLIVSIGAWRDPDHRIRYDDPTHPQSLRFHSGEDEYHVSVGTSLAVGQWYEAGIAYDFSRRQRTASASVVVRF